MRLFCGIDWAETHHDVAIIDGDGQLVAKKRIADGPSGFTELDRNANGCRRLRRRPGPCGDRNPARSSWWPRCARRGGRCMRSIRWR